MTIGVAVETEIAELRVVYTERAYTLDELTRILVQIDEIWTAGRVLSVAHGLAVGQVYRAERDLVTATDGTVVSAPHRYESPRIGRLIMASPLDLSVVIPATTGVVASGSLAWYGVHLVKAALVDPARVGAWLPTLVASWRRAWADAARAGQERDEARARARSADLDAALARFLDIGDMEKPAVVQLVKVDEDVPEEIADALSVLTSDSPRRPTETTWQEHLRGVRQPRPADRHEADPQP